VFTTNISDLLLRLPALAFAITIHEFAHAYTASLRGDDTARHLGRVSLNPLVHLDPIGTICLVLGTFGWGKPVPVNPRNFRNPRWDDVLVSFAGPLSNLLSAACLGLLLRLVLAQYEQVPEFFLEGLIPFLVIAIKMNLVLAFFNLLPLFPLDGSHVLRGFLPARQRNTFDRFSERGPIILLGILLLDGFFHLGVLSAIIGPPIGLLFHLLVQA